MIDFTKYHIDIRYSEEAFEEQYEATVEEFPDIVEYADTYEEVYALITDSIETIVKVLGL